VEDRRTRAAEYLDQMVRETLPTAPILSDVLAGRLEQQDIVFIAVRHYAEIRTFIDIKLPSRMRLCPLEAASAKKFFAHVYCEEQGDFVAGADHASLFERFCIALDIGRDVLESEFQRYWPNYQNLLNESPSRRVVLRELAISYAWESVAPRIAGPLTKSVAAVVDQMKLAGTYRDAAEEYFAEHIEIDESHGKEALEALLDYVDTDEDMEFAGEHIRRTLTTENPWVLPLT